MGLHSDRHDPHAVRLAGHRPGRRHQSGSCGPWSEARRENRQDHGAGRRQARKLLDSIDTSTVVGLRDRALISVMTFAFARIGAVVAMRVEDYHPQGKRWWVRLHEKGGKRHRCRHTKPGSLPRHLYKRPASGDGGHFSFRSAAGLYRHADRKPDELRRGLPYSAPRPTSACNRRPDIRATGITAYLERAAPWKTRRLWPHTKAPRTTKLYDRSGDEITLDEVEWISI